MLVTMQVVMAKKLKAQEIHECRHGNYRDTQERGAPQIPWVPGLHSNHQSLIIGELNCKLSLKQLKEQ